MVSEVQQMRILWSLLVHVVVGSRREMAKRVLPLGVSPPLLQLKKDALHLSFNFRGITPPQGCYPLTMETDSRSHCLDESKNALNLHQPRTFFSTHMCSLCTVNTSALALHQLARILYVALQSRICSPAVAPPASQASRCFSNPKRPPYLFY